jgi:hypothetical protein
MTTPFAISGEVTLNGYVEQHAGAPTRIITLSGTTGVLPGRESVSAIASNINSVLGGSVPNTNPLGRFAGNIASSLTNTSNGPTNVYEPKGLVGTDDGVKTGYVNFRLLEMLFEVYAELKASGTEDSKKLRLGFSMYKDDHVYLCTPIMFTRRRTKSTPLEYMYEIKLKAWKRINWVTQAATPVNLTQKFSSNVFARLANTITEARIILQASKSTITSTIGNIESTILNPLRQMSLMVKDGAGLVQTLNDIPTEVFGSIANDIILSWNNIKTGVNFSQGISAELAQLNQAFSQTQQNAIGTFTGKLISETKQQAAAGIFYGGGTLPGGVPNNSFNIGTLGKVFSNPDAYAPVFSQIPINNVNLSNASAQLIQQTILTARNTSKQYIQQIINNLQSAEAAFADSVGLGSPIYDATYGLTPIPQSRVAVQSDYDALSGLRQSIVSLQQLISVVNFNPSNPIPSKETYIANLANASNISFNLPQSKFIVPFPYGFTLERLAALYLGDPNRWIEIATLNSLQDPYVDEEGFDLEFIAPPVGSQVVVGPTTNLYVGQTVWCISNLQSNFKTTILAIKQNLDNTLVLTLDILQNFDQPFNLYGYTALHAFLPNTVNSQNLIYIPSEFPSNNTENDYSGISGVNNIDNLLAVGGIDLLLDQDNDLIITNSGGFLYSFGLQNIIQQIRLIFTTEKGSILHHPEYGFPTSVGSSLADSDPQVMVSTIQNIFQNNPTFTSVKGISVTEYENSVTVNATVAIAGQGNLLPLSISINKN